MTSVSVCRVSTSFKGGVKGGKNCHRLFNLSPLKTCQHAKNRNTIKTSLEVLSRTIESLPSNTIDVFSQDDWDSFVAGFTTQYNEHAMFVDLDQCVIEGKIPTELCGTLLRNGPGLYEIGDKKIPQPFDGDGMAVMCAFPGDGRLFVANRFIRTADFLAEQQAGKMLFRGAFSVGNPSGDGLYNPFDFSIKKPANTGILAWAGRILGLYERDLPYELTSPELRTVGRTDCDGAIDGDYFAAHYRIMDGRLIAFNSSEAGLDNKLTIWEFDGSGKQLHKTNVVLPDASFAFLHDFAVTEKHYIFIENPVRLDFGKILTKYMFGRACLAECLQYDPQNRKTKIHVIPRPGTNQKMNIQTAVYSAPQPFFSFHHSNAYEHGDGRIVVDTVALLDGMDFSANLNIGPTYFADNVGRGSLVRLEITPWTGQVEMTKLMDRACEFPTVAPSVVGRKHRHAYLVGARMDDPRVWGATQVVVKATNQGKPASDGGVPQKDSIGVNVTPARVAQTVYNPGPGKWAGEPIFVPRRRNRDAHEEKWEDEEKESDEDDGWVMTFVFDSLNGGREEKSTELVILNGRDLSVAARIRLPFFLPSGLHGSWTNEYLGPVPSDVPYSPKTYDIRTGAHNYE